MTIDSSGYKRPYSNIEATYERADSLPSHNHLFNASELIDYVRENKVPKNAADFKLVSSKWYNSFLSGSTDSVYLAKGYAGEKLNPDAFNEIVHHYGFNDNIISCRVAVFSKLDEPFRILDVKLAYTVAEELQMEAGSELWAVETFSVFPDERISESRKHRIIALDSRFEDLNLSATESLVVFFPSHSPLGRVGLSNMGNTCFMNSSLQILVHIPELIQFFVSGDFLKDLNTENPIGCRGQIAAAFAQLLRQIYDRAQRVQTLRPADFMRAVGRFHRSFASRIQQDSQEFTVFLLDSLHEDLNRIVQKPSTEKPELPDGALVEESTVRSLAQSSWDVHKKRNDSKIMDLFTGMYKSTLICPECEKISITFDPFFDLTLPLQTGSVWIKRITIVPNLICQRDSASVIKLDVALHPGGSISQLKDQVVEVLSLKDDCKLVAGDIYASKFFRILNDSDTLSETIDNDDEIVIYELSGNQDHIHIPVYLRQNDSGFAVPFYISVRESGVNAKLILRQIERGLNLITKARNTEGPLTTSLLKELQAFVGSVEDLTYGYGGDGLLSLLPSSTRPDLSSENDEPFVDLVPEQPKHERIENLPTPASSPMAGPYSPAVSSVSSSPAPSSSLSSSISPLSSTNPLSESAAQAEAQAQTNGSYQADQLLQKILASHNLKDLVLIADISTDLVFNSDNFDIFQNSYAENARATLEEHKSVTLDECLRRFSQPEILGDQDLWYCPRCKDFRKAQKQLKLWRTPDILMVHLKRFSGFHNMSRKLDDLVNFPLDGLDLAEYVSSEARGGDAAFENGYIYDLFAVDNHFGGMGSGHYTSFVKDPFKQEWLDFNDSFVRPMDTSRVCTGAAYLLFYRKRATFPSRDHLDKLSLDIRCGSLQKQWEEQARDRKLTSDSPTNSSSPKSEEDAPFEIHNFPSEHLVPTSSKSDDIFKGQGRILGTK